MQSVGKIIGGIMGPSSQDQERFRAAQAAERRPVTVSPARFLVGGLPVTLETEGALRLPRQLLEMPELVWVKDDTRMGHPTWVPLARFYFHARPRSLRGERPIRPRLTPALLFWDTENGRSLLLLQTDPADPHLRWETIEPLAAPAPPTEETADAAGSA